MVRPFKKKGKIQTILDHDTSASIGTECTGEEVHNTKALTEFIQNSKVYRMF